MTVYKQLRHQRELEEKNQTINEQRTQFIEATKKLLVFESEIATNATKTPGRRPKVSKAFRLLKLERMSHIIFVYVNII